VALTRPNLAEPPITGLLLANLRRPSFYSVQLSPEYQKVADANLAQGNMAAVINESGRSFAVALYWLDFILPSRRDRCLQSPESLLSTYLRNQ
jgi:hypothetical protein